MFHCPTAHIGYLLPLIKIAECIAAGIHVGAATKASRFCLITVRSQQAGVLIGDSYAYLINHDVSLEIIEYRTQYYVFLMTAILKALGVPPSNIHISRESDYAMSVQFCKNKMRLCAVSTQSEIRSVGPEVHDTPWISPLVCPIHQALCDVHLGTDFQMGGLDQVRSCILLPLYSAVTKLSSAHIGLTFFPNTCSAGYSSTPTIRSHVSTSSRARIS